MPTTKKRSSPPKKTPKTNRPKPEDFRIWEGEAAVYYDYTKKTEHLGWVSVVAATRQDATELIASKAERNHQHDFRRTDAIVQVANVKPTTVSDMTVYDPRTGMDLAYHQVCAALADIPAALFDIGGSLEIEAIDEDSPPGFDDNDARAEVVRRAANGDRWALMALYLDGRCTSPDVDPRFFFPSKWSRAKTRPKR